MLFSVIPWRILHCLLVSYSAKRRNAIFFHFAVLTVIAFSPCVRVKVKIQFLMIAIVTRHPEIGEISCSHCLPKSCWNPILVKGQKQWGVGMWNTRKNWLSHLSNWRVGWIITLSFNGRGVAFTEMRRGYIFGKYTSSETYTFLINIPNCT